MKKKNCKSLLATSKASLFSFFFHYLTLRKQIFFFRSARAAFCGRIRVCRTRQPYGWISGQFANSCRIFDTLKEGFLDKFGTYLRRRRHAQEAGGAPSVVAGERRGRDSPRLHLRPPTARRPNLKLGQTHLLPPRKSHAAGELRRGRSGVDTRRHAGQGLS